MKVVHFHNGTGGGVLSVIRNLLYYRQHPAIENHVIYTINQDQISEYQVPGLAMASSEQVFYYSPRWNFYYTCRQLAKLLPAGTSVLVAHDWLELGMVSNLGLQYPVVQVLHGDFDYYYNLATLHQQNIDLHICVSSVIERKLRTKLGEDADVVYLRFPVPSVEAVNFLNDEIQIAYFVRDVTEERKQLKLLPEIESELIKLGVQANWYVAGKGMTQEQFKFFWQESFSNRIRYLGELDRPGIDQLLRSCNIMVLPSLSEGFPVAVVESMKYGLLPLVTHWDGAVSDLVINGSTGFSFEPSDALSYAVCISQLQNDKKQLQQMRKEAKALAEKLFDPNVNTLLYEKVFMRLINKRSTKIAFKAYGSRLDNKVLPNYFVTLIRNFYQ